VRCERSSEGALGWCCTSACLLACYCVTIVTPLWSQAAWIEAEKEAAKRAEARAADLAAREARLAAKEEGLAAQQQVGAGESSFVLLKRVAM